MTLTTATHYANDFDFFELFDGDTFDDEVVNGLTWTGYIDGEAVAWFTWDDASKVGGTGHSVL